ncbi:glycoside hydrolase family 97 protein [Sphingobacterium siyangense]|uniref:glycoside hydrolase family 97 protein n=1 Tax=Sphingobacterium siyangense TaxID=459529 RepID=UPI002FDCE637
MKKHLFILFMLTFQCLMLQARELELKSPNGNLVAKIFMDKSIHYALYHQGVLVLDSVHLGMQLADKKWEDIAVLKKQQYIQSNTDIFPVVPLKFSKIQNQYNTLNLTFKSGFSLEFRLYDDGIAHRFKSDTKQELKIQDEIFDFSLPESYVLHGQQVSSFKTAYEEPYSHFSSADWSPRDKKTTLPLLLSMKEQLKLLISEANLQQYPAMFLQSKGQNKIHAVFPKVPLEFGDDGDRSVKILKEADYIASISGQRDFPWRFVVVSTSDKSLLENTMAIKLGAKSVIADPSWIRPGQVSWEWWHDASPYGPDVDFVAGYNTDTYKYYIDFAAKHGIPYIIMDEGWAKSTMDPFTPNANVDVHELIRYGKEKNVGVVLWLTWLTVEKNFDIFKTFQEWGVKGIKIDFMDRSDQWMVDFYERVAVEASKHKLFVDFHGSFKPAGLELKYPNVLSYEGVRGMEQMGGAFPNNSLYLPFIRNVVGPMDYTPGAMISMQPEVYRSERPNSASIGTRAYQMALFVVFESGLQMLADNPSLYYRNPDCTEFITNVPTTWDETRAIHAEAGKYVVIAKRKGDKWYIGAIANNDQKWREFKISLDFLKKDQTYLMKAFSDGINAPRQAMDYRSQEKIVSANEELNIQVARNGGWAAVIESK